MVRNPDDANDIQAARTTALCKSQVGPPFRYRNVRFGEDERALEVSRLEKSVVLELTMFFDPNLPPQLYQ
jgi:hypothetical protein